MIPTQCLNTCRAAFKSKQSQPQDVQRQRTSHQTMETESTLGNNSAYSSIDPFMLETAAGKPGFGSISLLEHVRDPCIFQEKMRHLEMGKATGTDGIPNELLEHLPESSRQAAQSTKQGKTWMKVMQTGPNFTMSIREGNC